ncbi:aminotransferase class I/II-fold pyridoxal phosphate-dependent enzyme [Halomonas garicola]|uniref:aminotransferase class I/II-fold pyridoxal phosphate-dependent enzyme n=1 Tax=Halomonas garicola TaxID=1690008 RepID=UPI00289D8478|nr:aminotransferase class I/II-fold pyridoxal phosphate-dependent enzyme [Halomonas garicola]
MEDSTLKQKLLARARRRSSPRAAEATGGERPAPSTGNPAGDYRTWTDFTAHPGYQHLALMRQGASRLGLTDPFFKVHEGTAGATSTLEGQTFINFASYNYLGYSGDPRVNQAARDAVERYGTSVSASRAVSGERPIHQALEQALADVYGAEDAVAFVSGHATNVSTLGYLLGPRDLVLHDEYIHNSSLVGTQLSGAKRMPFKHNDPQSLEALLARHRHRFERVLVIIEGLYSMDGDAPDLARFASLKKHHEAWLMVDEAHALGVLGERGRGLYEHCGTAPDDVDIWMGTLSKTLAGCGGYIAGSRPLVEMLRYFAPGFLYSVGMPAQVAAPALKALELMRAEPERVARLHAISGYFLAQAQKRGLDTGYSIGAAVVPVIVGNSPQATRLCQALFDQGINVQPIVYPAVPENSARLRFFLSCDHTQEQIDRTLDILQQQLDDANTPR